MFITVAAEDEYILPRCMSPRKLPVPAWSGERPATKRLAIFKEALPNATRFGLLCGTLRGSVARRWLRLSSQEGPFNGSDDVINGT
jgi:hypothetical protein